MKHLLIPIIFMIFSWSSCRKPAEPPTLTSVLISKEWKVSVARDFGVNYTPFYNGMKFTFTGDGKVKINDGTTVHNGTWSENANDGTFFMDIASPSFQFDFISQQWKVVTASLTGINLVDDEINTTQELRFSVY